MAEESNVTSATLEPPQPNTPEARTADGTLKDASSTQTQPTPTPEPKTDDTTPAKSSVPEKYEFTAPDGIKLDDTLIAEATPVFKELGLDQAAAQKLVNLVGKHSSAQADLAVKAVEQMRQGWQQDVAKEFGGKVDSIKADVGRMYDTVFAGDTKGREAFINAMNLTGAGDHPAIVKTMWKLSEAYREGQHVSGGGPSPHGQSQTPIAKPSAAAAMYPNLAH